MGFRARSYQENRRSSYILDGVELSIDEWPKLQPYLEVEGPREEAVHKTVQKLGFSRADTSTLHPTEMYAAIGIDVNTVPELKF